MHKGIIFLKEVQFWEYQGNTDEKLNSTRYKFTENGEFGIKKVNLITKEVERLVSKTKIETSTLIENYPVFDNFDNIIKIERKMPISM